MPTLSKPSTLLNRSFTKSILSHLSQFSLSWLHCTASALFDRLDRALSWLLGISPEVVREIDQISRDRDEFYAICLSEIEPVVIEPVAFPCSPLRPANRKTDDEMVCCLMPNGENFIFIYNESTRVEAMKLLGECAADPTHPLSWYDVAQMTKLMREMAIERQWHNAKHGPSQDG